MNFREFIELWESVTDEIAKLERDIAQIDTTINRQSEPLQRRREQLIKLIATKRKQSEDQKSQNNQPDNNQQQTNQMTAQQRGNSSAGIL